MIDAGSVTASSDGATLRVVQVSPNSGWVVEIEAAVGRELEVTFRSGGVRVDFKAELEDGQIRIRIRDRRID